MEVIIMVGLLEALAAMSVGKLILLGLLALIVGIPVLIFLVGTVIAITAIIGLSDNPPWGKHGISVREKISLKTRALGWGIFFLAVGLGIIVAVASKVTLIWGIAGIALLFGGIGLIIFYFIAARTERKEILLSEE
jgi:uncharacterized membrane protein HdeD (DUF308 family)